MSVQPAGKDIVAVYTSQNLVQRYLPVGGIADAGDTTPGAGKILVSDLTSIIREQSRIFDGEAGAAGFEVPFPNVTATNPRTPEPCTDIVTKMVVAECRSILAFGNRKNAAPTDYRKVARTEMRELLRNPKRMGFGQVSTESGATPELLTKVASTDQYGVTQSSIYRLRNRNLMQSSLRFVRSTGVEVFRSDGFPFSVALGDYAIMSQSESLIILYNEAEILNAVGAGGGVVYRFSWHRMSFGQSHAQNFPGVSTL